MSLLDQMAAEARRYETLYGVRDPTFHLEPSALKTFELEAEQRFGPLRTGGRRLQASFHGIDVFPADVGAWFQFSEPHGLRRIDLTA